MIDEGLLQRITVNPGIFGGRPIIRGMRISVELILSLLAQGETPETILTDYPDLEPDGLRACLAYAHAVIAHDKLDSVQVIQENELASPSITLDPEILDGTPVFRGTRVPVDALLNNLEAGVSIDEFLENFPTVSREQVLEIIKFSGA